jgi:hypothetical protein
MTESDRGLSPFLGGPRARVPQIFLLVIHVFLEIALVWLAIVYWRIAQRLPFEAWQIWVFGTGIAFCFLAFAWRTFVIARDLLRATGSGRDSADIND